jgi:hypothetical protein
MRTDDNEYDDENFETTPRGTRILRDGGRVRVSLMDAVDARSPRRLHDGRGSALGHRPGFAFSDTSMRDERVRAYAAYEHEITTAWQRDIDKPQSRAEQPQRDAALTMDEVYAEYDRNLEQAYRSQR